MMRGRLTDWSKLSSFQSKVDTLYNTTYSCRSRLESTTRNIMCMLVLLTIVSVAILFGANFLWIKSTVLLGLVIVYLLCYNLIRSINSYLTCRVNTYFGIVSKISRNTVRVNVDDGDNFIEVSTIADYDVSLGDFIQFYNDCGSYSLSLDTRCFTEDCNE